MKKSPAKALFWTLSTIAAAATAAAVAYKFIKNKTSSKILGGVDFDGDGEVDAVMLDTTGNGEVDTIIINTEPEDEEPEETTHSEE